MNYSLALLEMAVIATGLGVLLLDLWAPADLKRKLGYAAAAALGVILLLSFSRFIDSGQTATAFQGMFVLDPLALFFKRLFLVAGILVLLFSVEFADRIATGISEFYSLLLFALAGMMTAASANDFALLFVALELITVTFYVLTSFQRSRVASLEAGVKYLILGALASAFLVYGIALVYGVTGHFRFDAIARVSGHFSGNPLFLAGLLFILAGLGFKIAAFPFQIWAPDVYQGSPTPTTAFLAIGSKAAGFALLLRVLFTAIPDVIQRFPALLPCIAAVTILYGNLCALPQRNIKRLLGYSSISNAGYLLLGITATSPAGQSALLFYLAGYLFSVLAAFGVIAVVLRHLDSDDITGLAGLGQRSPFLAATLTLAMVSLAGIPPLAGFFGKFLLLKAVVEQAPAHPSFYWLVGVALFGIVVSLYYYFGVVRAIYWGGEPIDRSPVNISQPARIALGVCVAGIFYLGLFPGNVVRSSTIAATSLQPSTQVAVTPR